MGSQPGVGESAGTLSGGTSDRKQRGAFLVADLDSVKCLVTSSFLSLVVMPGATSSFLLLVVRCLVTSSFLSLLPFSLNLQISLFV